MDTISTIRAALDAFDSEDGPNEQATLLAIAKAVDDLDARPPVENIEIGMRATHRKTGASYGVLGLARVAQSADVVRVVYRGPNGSLWLRDCHDFRKAFGVDPPRTRAEKLQALCAGTSRQLVLQAFATAGAQMGIDNAQVLIDTFAPKIDAMVHEVLDADLTDAELDNALAWHEHPLSVSYAQKMAARLPELLGRVQQEMSAVLAKKQRRYAYIRTAGAEFSVEIPASDADAMLDGLLDIRDGLADVLRERGLSVDRNHVQKVLVSTAEGTNEQVWPVFQGRIARRISRGARQAEDKLAPVEVVAWARSSAMRSVRIEYAGINGRTVAWRDIPVEAAEGLINNRFDIRVGLGDLWTVLQLDFPRVHKVTVETATGASKDVWTGAPASPAPVEVVAGLLEVSAAALGLNGGPRYLVGQRAGNRAHRGCWEFPGGKVEPRESVEDAVVREWAEEVGAEVIVRDVDGPLAEYTGDSAGTPFHLRLYCVELTPERARFTQEWARAQQRLAGPAHSAFAWKTLEEIVAMPVDQLTPSMPTLVQMLVARRIAKATGATIAPGLPPMGSIDERMLHQTIKAMLMGMSYEQAVASARGMVDGVREVMRGLANSVYIQRRAEAERARDYREPERNKELASSGPRFVYVESLDPASVDPMRANHFEIDDASADALLEGVDPFAVLEGALTLEGVRHCLVCKISVEPRDPGVAGVANAIQVWPQQFVLQRANQYYRGEGRGTGCAALARIYESAHDAHTDAIAWATSSPPTAVLRSKALLDEARADAAAARAEAKADHDPLGAEAFGQGLREGLHGEPDAPPPACYAHVQWMRNHVVFTTVFRISQEDVQRLVHGHSPLDVLRAQLDGAHITNGEVQSVVVDQPGRADFSIPVGARSHTGRLWPEECRRAADLGAPQSPEAAERLGFLRGLRHAELYLRDYAAVSVDGDARAALLACAQSVGEMDRAPDAAESHPDPDGSVDFPEGFDDHICSFDRAGLEGAVDDVADFMDRGQADQVSSELRTPEMGAYGGLIEDLVASCKMHTNELRHWRRDVREEPPVPSDVLGLSLIVEEVGELAQAMLNGKVEDFADGLVDLIYVAIGAGLRCGIPLASVWAEVHRANMMKFPDCPDCGGTGRAP